MKVVFRKILSFLASTSNRLKLNVFSGFFTRHAKTLGLSLLAIQFVLFLSALVHIDEQIKKIRWDIKYKQSGNNTSEIYDIKYDIIDKINDLGDDILGPTNILIGYRTSLKSQITDLDNKISNLGYKFTGTDGINSKIDDIQRDINSIKDEINSLKYKVNKL